MKIIKFLINRATLITLMLILQIVFLAFLVYYLSDFFWYAYIVLEFMSLIVVLYIVNKGQDPTTKMPWLTVVLLIPPFGAVIYLIFNTNMPRKKQLKAIKKIRDIYQLDFEENNQIQERLNKVDKRAYGQINYIYKSTACPAYQNTKDLYFSTGEKFFENLIKQLKNAKKFIFMEYFIIDNTTLWKEIYEILKQKANSGVEVKIIYDDIGSIYKLPYNFNKKISAKNIECLKFNKYKPIISAVHNNRDHRKMTIIDGIVAFTGGINIADEYANRKVKFGHWKDSGLMLKGDGVRSMMLEFLNTFYSQKSNGQDIKKYFSMLEVKKYKSQGLVQPFFDGPFPIYKDRVGENAYINLINQASNYIYITTPYLIIDFNFLSSLKLASKRGVDVRIITPHMPDKKIIFLQTQATYKQLLLDGVKIFEYTPGFMHAKTIVCDDVFAIIGTFNVDYRSFVHHFENGVLLCQTKSVLQIKKDFEKTLKVCKTIKVGNYKFGIFKKFISDILSIFSSLM